VERIKINDKYKPLWINNTRYFIITGGRGSGKSFANGLFIENLTWEQGHKILFTRYTLNSAQISIIPEFQEKIELHSSIDNFDITKAEISNKHTGSQIIFRGIKTSSGNQTANLKSIQGITTWVLDEGEELVDEEIFDKIDESIRQKGIQNRVIIVLNPSYKKHWIYKKFFETPGVKYDFNGINDNVTYIHTTYEDNKENLSESFIEKAEKLREINPAKYLHRFGGHWIDEVSGALWQDKLFKHVDELPEFRKVCIALDPSITGKDDSDECGIICAGLGFDNYIYVFRDETGIYTPLKWANKAVYLHENLKANCVVAEVNQGGDMVKTIINQIEPRIKVEMVWSKVGKVLRAEPIVSLYEQGLVRHLRGLTKLENEMTTWTPDEGYSPGRIDALVHGINYLYESNKKPILSYG
jgi:phage terminase large subunit